MDCTLYVPKCRKSGGYLAKQVMRGQAIRPFGYEIIR
jgi:hypothetical protein